MENGKIKKLVPLAQTKFLNLYDSTYTNKLGQERHWIISSRKDTKTLEEQYFMGAPATADAVVLVATHKPTESLVLVRQFRVPLNDYIYELPAGLIDKGETPFSSVERELREETGLKLISIDNEKSRLLTYLSPGMTEEGAGLIFCTCEGELSTEFLEADEDITPLLVDAKKAREIIASDEKIDMKAYMALLHLTHK